MRTYTLTVFEKDGEKILDETFTAGNDEEAKITGISRLEKRNYSEYTHRCVTADGKLILFHR